MDVRKMPKGNRTRAGSDATPNIVHVTTAHTPFDTRIFHHECVSLADEYGRVYLIAAVESSSARQGVEMVPLRRRRSRRQRLLWSVPEAFRECLRLRPAVFHIHDPELLPVGAVLSWMGSPVIFDVHEHFSEIAKENSPRGLKQLNRFVVRVLTEWLPKSFCTKLIYATEALMVETVGPHPKGSVVRNLPSVRDVIELEPMVPKSHDLVFLGTISPFRMEVLMRAYEMLLLDRPSLSWLFIGIPRGTVDWTLSHYAGSRVLGGLTFHDRVDFEVAMKLVSSCKIGVNYHPLQRRFQVAIPNKVLEYMAAGLPVVTTSFPELSTLFRPNELIQFDDRSPIGLAKAISETLDDHPRATSVAVAGQRAVRDRVNWEVASGPVLKEVYDDIFEGLCR